MTCNISETYFDSITVPVEKMYVLFLLLARVRRAR